MYLYTPHAAYVDTASGAVLVLDQLEGGSTDPGTQAALRSVNVDPEYAAAVSVAPLFELVDTDLAAILAANSNTFLYAGLLIDSGVSNAGMEIYLKKRAAGAEFASGAVNEKALIGDGHLWPQELVASQGEDATISMLMEALSTDGLVVPVVYSAAELPAASAVSILHTLGPVNLNGSRLAGVQEIRYAAGIERATRWGDGGIYPIYTGIRRRRTSFAVAVTDASILRSIGLTGEQQTTSNTILYLRKRTAGGGLVADVTAEHIKITIRKSYHTIGSIALANGEDILPAVIITPIKDGANAIMTVSAASAIT